MDILLLSGNMVAPLVFVGTLSLLTLFMVSRFNSLASATGSLLSVLGFGKSSVMPNDQRRRKRIPCHIPIQIYDYSGNIPTGSGVVINKSETGACVESPACMYLGQIFNAHTLSANHRDTLLIGRVVWIRPEGHTKTYGIQF